MQQRLVDGYFDIIRNRAIGTACLISAE
jgi:hypothetical protein